MKLTYFKGVGYQVPDWAEYIAQDDIGGIYVYETKPEWVSPYWVQKGTFWRCEFVSKVSGALLLKI